MKPIIAIPSYRRPESVAIKKLKEIDIPKYLFIRPEEHDVYAEIAKDSDFHLVFVKDVTDVGTTRKKVVEYCNEKGFDWVFMLDDDISKLEALTYLGNGKSKPTRLVENPEDHTQKFEIRAFKEWFSIAKKYKLSLSAPNGIHDYFSRGYLKINHALCVQCVLLYIPDIIAVGNYRSLNETGNEDFYMQYMLMSSGYRCGKIGTIEYACPEIGANAGGNSAVEYVRLIERYKELTNTFMNNVCRDPKQIVLKQTDFGQPYMRFAWKYWDNKEDVKLWEI